MTNVLLLTDGAGRIIKFGSDGPVKIVSINMDSNQAQIEHQSAILNTDLLTELTDLSLAKAKHMRDVDAKEKTEGC